MGSLPETWIGEDCIITFETEDTGAVVNAQAKITGIDFGGGTRPTEDIYAFGGATLNYSKPREKYTLSFDVIAPGTFFDAVNTSTTSGIAAAGAVANVENVSSSSAKEVRIILWFQDSDSHKQNTAKTITVPNKSGSIYRVICVNSKVIDLTKTMSGDGAGFEGSLSIEFSATDSSGYPNFIAEFTNSQSTSALTVLNTTTHRGLLTWNTTTPAWSSGTTATMYKV